MRRPIPSMLLAIVAGAAITSPAPDARALEIAGASISPEGSLVLDFRDKNLPRERPIRYTLTAKMTAIFLCAPNEAGRLFPDARATTSRQVLEVKSFPSSSAGEVEGTITSPTPELPPLDCPQDTSPKLASVRYDQINLVTRYAKTMLTYVSWTPTPLP